MGSRRFAPAKRRRRSSATTCSCCNHDAMLTPCRQVVESCNWVYMDGTETHGSSSVTVITKYGRHTRFTFFEVWAPQIPVEVALSDNMLSQIKGWKVLSRQASSRCLLNAFRLSIDDMACIWTYFCFATRYYVIHKSFITECYSHFSKYS